MADRTDSSDAEKREMAAQQDAASGRAEADGSAASSAEDAAYMKADASKQKSSDDDNQENKTSARKGAIFLGFVVLAYVVILILTGQMGQFIDALGGINMHWVGVAAFCFVLYFVFGVTAYVIAVYIDHDSPVGVRDLMSVEASGVFFGNLTPMQAGSIPSQIYRLTKTGLDVGEASATQFTRFIAFQFGVVLFAALMLVAELEYFLKAFGALFYFNLFIFGIHFLELTALFVVCLCPGFVRKVGNWAIKFCDRHGWLKDRAHWEEMVNVQVQEFSDAFKRAMRDLPSMALTLLVTMMQLGCLYMIPWFVGRAFGVTGDFLECLAAGSMVQLVSTAIPLPGGTGGAEGSFMMFYHGLFGSSITAGFLVWRLITFILPTIIAAPLLSLRSNSSESIYHRWQRFIHGSGSATIKGDRSIGGRVRGHRGAHEVSVRMGHGSGKASGGKGGVTVPMGGKAKSGGATAGKAPSSGTAASTEKPAGSGAGASASGTSKPHKKGPTIKVER